MSQAAIAPLPEKRQGEQSVISVPQTGNISGRYLTEGYREMCHKERHTRLRKGGMRNDMTWNGQAQLTENDPHEKIAKYRRFVCLVKFQQ